MKALIIQVLMNFVLLSSCSGQKKLKPEVCYLSTQWIHYMNNDIQSYKEDTGICIYKDSMEFLYGDSIRNRSVEISLKSSNNLAIRTRNRTITLRNTDRVSKANGISWEYINLKAMSRKKLLKLLSE